MFVSVRAVHRENFPGFWTIGRLWPSSEFRRVEVIDGDGEPEMIDEDVFNDGKKIGTRKIPDPTKISRATFKELTESPLISIKDEVNEAAELKASALAEEHAVLTDENAVLKAQIAELTAKLEAQSKGKK